MTCNPYRTHQPVLLLVLCFLPLAFTLFSCGQAPSQEASLHATIGALQTQVAVLPQPAASPLASSNPNQASTQADGQSVVFDNWKVTVVEVNANTSTFTAPTFIREVYRRTAREGYRLVAARLALQNIGNSVERYETKDGMRDELLSFSISADGGYVYEDVFQLAERIEIGAVVPPLSWIYTWSVTEVPKNATGLKLIIKSQRDQSSSAIDLNNHFKAVSLSIPTEKDTSIQRIGSDKLVLPRVFAITLKGVARDGSLCNVTLAEENLGGYDISNIYANDGYLMVRAGDAFYIMDIVVSQNDGVYRRVEERPYNQELKYDTIAPGISKTQNFRVPCQSEQRSNITLAFYPYSWGQNPPLSRVMWFRVYSF